MNLSQAVWSFLIHKGHGMELTNQHVNADTNKSTASGGIMLSIMATLSRQTVL
jgi:hypothetical protein